MAILKIGNIDVSDYVLEGYQVQTRAVYDNKRFTNMLGQNVQRRIGTAYTINAVIAGVPGVLADTIAAACVDDVTIEFENPSVRQAMFKCPSITSTLICEAPKEWDIAISAETDTIPLDGL